MNLKLKLKRDRCGLVAKRGDHITGEEVESVNDTKFLGNSHHGGSDTDPQHLPPGEKGFTTDAFVHSQLLVNFYRREPERQYRPEDCGNQTPKP